MPESRPCPASKSFLHWRHCLCQPPYNPSTLVHRTALEQLAPSPRLSLLCFSYQSPPPTLAWLALSISQKPSSVSPDRQYTQCNTRSSAGFIAALLLFFRINFKKNR